ncbi:MAG: 3-hydroxyacyl-CoA dehydrogenase NAD-binding domain-containing protein [Martelella sp.]|uniref:3-hydroxyacyl-CoA dehydrogenase NAD-binding domain-containing protein n=1 Tax=Martelella sp. TaxID=1969699 RepID=UPI003242B002
MDVQTEPNRVVRTSLKGRVWLAEIDNPPVNAGALAVRAELLSALRNLPVGASAVVIRGTGRCFVSGSDLKEFSGPLLAPEWPEVFAAVEACPLPVVAAMHGVALGGGYELALACDWRLAAAKTLVGLPEVSLGILPGAGGTQRLPRLTGRAEAIRLICSAARVEAQQALALGMVDAIVEPDDVLACVERLVAENPGKRRLMELPVEDGEELADVSERAVAKAPNWAAAERTVEMVSKADLARPAAEALAEERAIFHMLRASDQAAALRHVFFAERAAAKAAPRVEQAAPVETVGVVGAGTMGAGIAATLAAAGLSVQLHDADSDALARGLARVVDALEGMGRHGKLKGSVEEAVARTTSAGTIAALRNCDLVIEAVVERLDIKRAVMGALCEVVSSRTVLASNTSYLDIDAIAAGASMPERVLGLHFFAPVPRMKLVEVVAGAATGDEPLVRAMALARRIGKLPIVAGNREGFIGNRIYAAYRAQCEFLVQEGAMPWDVDKAIEAMGLAMGPFKVGDLSGLDIGWHMRRSKDASRDPAARYVDLPDRLYEMGRLGRKTGAGWYAYPAGGGRPEPDDVVAKLVREGARGPVPDAERIRRRALGAIVNEAALVLAEGVARSADDIDLVMLNGYGFRRETGGPAFMASRMSAAKRSEMLDEVEAATGFGFRRGYVEKLVSNLL